MRGFIFVVSLVILPMVGMAQSQGVAAWNGWQAEVGVGALAGPAYAGSEETKVRALPIINLTAPDERMFFSTRDGAGYKFIKNAAMEIGAAITYVPGRDSGDDDRIRGLKDIDGAAGAKVFGQYQLTREVFLQGDITQQVGGAQGLRATVGVGAFKPITERLAVVGNLGTTWAGEDDQTEWFGINAAQNAASGLPVYDANAGFRDIEASVVANYKLTEHWGVSLGGGVNRLLGDAADSPISKEDTGVSMFTGVSYKF